jgi:hypothetical protein
MDKFLFLFRSVPVAQRGLSPEQMQAAMQKWIDWKDQLAKDGHIKSWGDRMDATGKVVRGKTKSITDGPYVEVKDSIQGYLVIEAADMDQAVELAQGCPILDVDGSVEVRQFITQS